MKGKAFSLEVDASKELISYQKSQKKISSRPFKHSNIQELIEQIINSKVIYLGDFHSLDQNSRNFERISKALLKDQKSFSIAVEFIYHKDQQVIDHYLQGAITEIEMLEEVEYHESWKFPWKHYKPFFDIAKSNQLKIIALNSQGSLSQRDDFAAKILSQHILSNPNERTLVFFGELHILPEKLPLKVRKHLKKEIAHTIIHQNLDDVYFKVFEDGPNHHIDQIIKFEQNEFVLLTSPPWIKYESMVYWYENLMEDPEFDIHHYIMNTSLTPLSSDVPDNFHFLTTKIADALGVEVEDDLVEDFNLYDHTKLKVMSSRIDRIPVVEISELYRKLIQRSESFRLPFSSIFYCSSYSINRISFLAGLHLQDLLIKRPVENYESFLILQKDCELFIHFIKQFIAGYLASKIINPQRKCDLYLDLKNKYLSSPNSYLDFCLTFFEWDLKKKSLKGMIKDKLHTKEDLFSAAKTLGFYLGDRLYEASLAKDKKVSKDIFKFIYSESLEESSLYELLKKLVPKKSYLKHKKRYF